ncbi:lactate utilization protein [Hahella aquimaris]|uniref:LutC/YkgG family protein n=1 Tax=Hahella sp. HNIBRBA332 TaxID=3015983 RepID=UPI00273C1295|nr:lactate utilization protein [Hahella sp. HNIBRBA332]WLQ12029.1 lactate utilization protein [Hahella sp. HNIBRBA332]
MSSREAILNRLRTYRQPKPSQPAQAPAAASATLSIAEKVRLFTENLHAAHAEVITATQEDWTQRLLSFWRETGVHSVIYAPNTAHGQAIESAAHAYPELQLQAYEEDIETCKDRLFNHIQCGFGAAMAGIAETGTLMVKTGADEPRALSLVPPTHSLLIHAKDLYTDLPEALHQTRIETALPTNLLLISGPSKTADIQQTLAYGAHGPKRLVVVLIVAEESDHV